MVGGRRGAGRRAERRDRDDNPDADAYAYPDADPYAYPDADGDPDIDRDPDGDRDPDIDRDPDQHVDRDSHGDPHRAGGDGRWHGTGKQHRTCRGGSHHRARRRWTCLGGRAAAPSSGTRLGWADPLRE
jgi:hypothetical protein